MATRNNNAIRRTGGFFMEKITKSTFSIIRDNVCTLFNLLNFIIALLLFLVGAYSNMLFIAIIILNIVIGITQELKAKKLVDELSILNRPTVCVVRNSSMQNINMEEVCKGDTIFLQSGDQICNDSMVTDGTLEVDKSLLTGESDAIIKTSGSTLLSGSFVISGKAYAKVIHAGSDNYASKLVNEVKKGKNIHSELLDSMKKVTHFTSFFILPLGVCLFLQAIILRNMPFYPSVVSSCAALLGMLPKGLVLLISVSLTAGVIRLAKKKILIQNIYSLETLAHVDILCLDKTGTITDGNLKVDHIFPMSEIPKRKANHMIQSYFAASDDNNATFLALKDAFGSERYDKETSKISFSSQRKWGCVNFQSGYSIFVGAPDKLLDQMPEQIRTALNQGKRAVVIGYYENLWEDKKELPKEIHPIYGVILEDHIRKNTKETLDFFYKQGVDVKIISGDHQKTVSMIAKKAGLKDWNKVIDLSTIKGAIDFEKISEEYCVFARVTPDQKQKLVRAMRQNKHQVAMTGDGVNDLLALREADCAIAVADGSDASRQFADKSGIKLIFRFLW